MIKKLAATGVLGFAITASTLATAPAAFAGGHGHGHGHGHHGKKDHGSFSNNETKNNFGILNGNQIFVPISVAANVCGVGVGVLGHGAGQAKCDAESEIG